MKDYDEFKTFDLALAAALVVNGFNPSVERVYDAKRVSFVFKQANNLNGIIEAYWANTLTVNPKAYFDALKHLKTRIYMAV